MGKDFEEMRRSDTKSYLKDIGERGEGAANGEK
jgi:hypothetical protein